MVDSIPPMVDLKSSRIYRLNQIGIDFFREENPNAFLRFGKEGDGLEVFLDGEVNGSKPDIKIDYSSRTVFVGNPLGFFPAKALIGRYSANSIKDFEILKGYTRFS